MKELKDKSYKSRAENGSTDEWLTPPSLVKALGEFDLDPCSPVNKPWVIAKNEFTILDNGLIRDWTGRVFLPFKWNYGKQGVGFVPESEISKIKIL